ncbi:MAG: hypothetical protein EB127_10255 [Alphaproteobacteria bacterium]|nr:hypothetical protein [Alphaproteobacteria bacterium]
MTNINSRTITRIAVIQSLYQSINQKDQNFDQIANSIKSLYHRENRNDLFDMENKKFRIRLNSVMFDTISHFANQTREKIEGHISGYFADSMPYEKSGQTLRALLIAAVAETMIFPETPMQIIVSEYTNIASEMLHDKEVGFVNSVLDNIIKNIKKDEI